MKTESTYYIKIHNKIKFVHDKIITVKIIGFGIVKKRDKNLRSKKNSQHIKRFELAGIDGKSKCFRTE